MNIAEKNLDFISVPKKKNEKNSKIGIWRQEYQSLPD